MGKVKTVTIGDEQAEEKARKAAQVKREQKKLAKGRGVSSEGLAKSDREKAQDILKMMAEEEKDEIKSIKTIKPVTPIKTEKLVEESEKEESEKEESDNDN